MQNIKTIAGTFTIGTYEIPKQYVCAKTPTITQKNDICVSVREGIEIPKPLETPDGFSDKG